MKGGDFMRRHGITGWFLFISLLVAGCKDGGTAPTGPTPSAPASNISFRQNVLPVLTQSGCVGCHGGTSGLQVGTVASLLAGGNHGPAIVPGKPDSSIMIQKIGPNPPFGDRMPQGGPYLSGATIQMIRTWVAEGAKDN